MFVLLISFIFVLILSLGRTTVNKNVLLKDKLTQSLTHLKDILVNIEAKIEHETKTLSEINYDLNHKQHPAVGRIDYDQVTNIWWKSESPVAPADGIPETKTETPFIQDLKKTMKEDNHNYLTAFLKKIIQSIATKNIMETMPVLSIMRSEAEKELNKGTFKNIDENIVTTLNESLLALSNILPNLKEHASWFYLVINNKDIVLNPQYQHIDVYGTRFTEADGEKLFEAMESFNDYPNGTKTAAEVSGLILQALWTPLLRKQVGSIYVYNTTETAEIVTKSPAQRRSMNYEKNVKHFLLNHLNFNKMKQQYTSFKKNKHHHLSHMQKLDQNYRRSHDGNLNKRHQTRQRAHIPSEDYNHSENSQASVEKDMFHKLRDASSYSDEEDHLRNNLYDALRHGNRTFVSFRKSDGGVNNKQTLLALSSETDDEWVLKKNIYKVFEQKKKCFIN